MKTQLLKPQKIERELYTEDSFEDMLNDNYGDVEICGMSFQQGTALKELDPIAFNCSMNDSQEYTDVYICPLCGAEHEDEEEAKFCCQIEDEDE
jgi:hypothetical protein